MKAYPGMLVKMFKDRIRNGSASPMKITQTRYGRNEIGELFPSGKLQLPAISFVRVLDWSGDVQRADGRQETVSNNKMYPLNRLVT
jgi:hypothetical protein